MYQRALKLASCLKINLPFFVHASLRITQFTMTLLLVNTSWIINCAPFNTITIYSLCFPQVALLFISLLWKLLSLELFNLISVDKKHSFTALKFVISALNFVWPLSCPIKTSISFVGMHCYVSNDWLNFTSF